jgi:hypothetical protein
MILRKQKAHVLVPKPPPPEKSVGTAVYLDLWKTLRKLLTLFRETVLPKANVRAVQLVCANPLWQVLEQGCQKPVRAPYSTRQLSQSGTHRLRNVKNAY